MLQEELHENSRNGSLGCAAAYLQYLPCSCTYKPNSADIQFLLKLYVHGKPFHDSLDCAIVSMHLLLPCTEILGGFLQHAVVLSVNTSPVLCVFV